MSDRNGTGNGSGLLDKYLHRDANGRPHDHSDSAPAQAGVAENGAADNLGSFGLLRGIRDRAVMLELRKADGSIMAIGYGWLERAEFDPTDGITLHVLGRTVRIKGRNLNGEVRSQVRLFEGIARHRVPWIQQTGEPTTSGEGDRGAVVCGIEW